MKRLFSILLAAIMLGAASLAGGCDSSEYAASNEVIIPAKDLAGYIGKENTVIVDMQPEEEYAAGHIEGAVNIQVSSVLVNLPVDNMLASKGKVQTTLGEAGIGNDTQVIIYDEGGSLNASRLWWTMLVYGHENAKVVSGGLPALKSEGYEMSTAQPSVTPKEFVAEDHTGDYVADRKAVMEQLDNPDKNVILLDNRSDEEYQTEGKIPSSILYPHTKNFYKDGTFLDVQATRINYIEQGIRTENEVIMYCRTSMRSATTFLLLYNAGYRNLKMYDGAYLEWSAGGNNPIEMPEGGVPSSPRDNS